MKLAILYRESTLEAPLFDGANPGHYWCYAFSPVHQRAWTGPYKSKVAAERNAETTVKNVAIGDDAKRRASR